MEELDASEGGSGAVDISFDGAGVPTIKLSGEIDMSNVDSLRRLIEPVVARAPEHVVFDLASLTFMDSSGIALLLQVSAKTGTVRLRGPSELVRRMIDATGLTDVLVVDS
jgi:anti-anti-sigma factor